MTEKEQSSEPCSPIESLPRDIVIDIIARVPIIEYPTLSIVSKQFSSLVSTRELYARRSLSGYAEKRVYAVFKNKETKDLHLYILQRKDNCDSRLVRVPKLPFTPYGSSFVAVGSTIYVFSKLSALCIDCACMSQTVGPLPNVPTRLIDTVAAADITKEKIHVFGIRNTNGCWMSETVVLNIKTQTWEEPKMITSKMEIMESWYLDVVVVDDDTVYVKSASKSFVHKPYENRRERDEVLDSNPWLNACVVDDVLYYFDRYEKELMAYDTKERYWGLVKGLDEFIREIENLKLSSNCVSCGGRLNLSLCGIREVWFAEISLERRKGGEIWGNVEWSDHVMIDDGLDFEKSLVVVA